MIETGWKHSGNLAAVSYRVVIPRSIPVDDANRVQQAVWKRGYSTRLGARDAADPGNRVVEFLRMVDELPDPSEVPRLERDLEELLAGTRVHTRFTGAGGWVETVRRPPRSRTA